MNGVIVSHLILLIHVGKNNRVIGIIAGAVAVGAALLFAAPVITLVYCKRRKPQDFFFDVAGSLIKRKDGLLSDQSCI